MNSTRFLFVFLISTQIAFSQLAEPLQFVEKIHDFGEIAEHNGLAVFEFNFTNKATRAVKILNVQPSCGCTTPGWTKELIESGKIGFIKVSFNPKDRPGYFSKTLTVTTDLDGNPIVLSIKGNVVDKKSTNTPYDLVVENGHLLFRNSSFNIGKAFINKEPTIAEFPMFNNGRDTIHFTETVAPKHIKVSIPKSLAPGASTKIKITFDAAGRNQYGFISDNIVLKTSDESRPDKSFSVYATVEEYFSMLTPEEQTNAPALKLDSYELDLGTLKKGITTDQTIRLRNPGKKELTIRFVQSNCSCVVAKASSLVLKPDGTAKMQISFIPDGREGLQNKAVTIYSTDPINPVQRLMIKAVIE